MKYCYGIDAYGNIHAFRSKRFRNELIDADQIQPLTYAEYKRAIITRHTNYLLVHNTNDLNVYTLIKIR